MSKYKRNQYGTEKEEKDPFDPFQDTDYQELKDVALAEAVRATGGKRSAFMPKIYDEENDYQG